MSQAPVSHTGNGNYVLLLVLRGRLELGLARGLVLRVIRQGVVVGVGGGVLEGEGEGGGGV